MMIALHSSGLGPEQWKHFPHALTPALTRLRYQDDVADIVALAQVQTEPVHLVGHSYGGFIALQVALQLPKVVRTLLAYEPVAFGVVPADPELAALRADPRFRNNEAWLELFVDWWNGQGTWAAMQNKTPFLDQRETIFAQVSSLEEDRTPLSVYVDALRMPVVIMSGSETPKLSQRVSKALGEGLSRGQHLVVKGAGHMGPLTHRREVTAAIMALSRA